MGSFNFNSDLRPFDSFIIMYKSLVWLGIYKLNTNNDYLYLCHAVYRAVVVISFTIYNIQHFIYYYVIIVAGKKVELETLIVTISQFSGLCKFLATQFNISKIEELHVLIKDPIFAAKTKKDKEYLTLNKIEMTKLYLISIGWVTLSILTWLISLVFQKNEDPSWVVNSYFPFRTDTKMGFLCSVLLDNVPLIWFGYGHFAIDCIIAAYYTTATTQIKILKYKLKHLFDDGKVKTGKNKLFQYKDVVDENLDANFIYCVKKYEATARLINLLSGAFRTGLFCQFLSVSIAMCLVIYNMSMTDIMSSQFLFMGALLSTYQFQNLIYCYYGNLVQFESDSVNSAIYSSDWLSVSPRFRRQIQIAMSRWHYPLTPRVSIVPLSLTTFVTIIRSAYTLYTVLKSSYNN